MTESTQPAQPVAHDAFLSAADLKRLIEKAQHAKAADKKKNTKEKSARDALIDELKKPVEITEQQVASAVQKFIIAAEAGETEMVVFRFPSQLCTMVVE